MKIQTWIMAGMMGVILAACNSGEEKSTETEQPAKTEQVIENVPAELASLDGVTSYWECPMQCEEKKFVSEGNCPICGMALTEVMVNKQATDSSSQLKEPASEEAHTH